MSSVNHGEGAARRRERDVAREIVRNKREPVDERFRIARAQLLQKNVDVEGDETPNRYGKAGSPVLVSNRDHGATAASRDRCLQSEDGAAIRVQNIALPAEKLEMRSKDQAPVRIKRGLTRIVKTGFKAEMIALPACEQPESRIQKPPRPNEIRRTLLPRGNYTSFALRYRLRR